MVNVVHLRSSSKWITKNCSCNRATIHTSATTAIATIITLSNTKTLSTAVEELRDTVNEKIGEEKTAREEVTLLMIMGVVKMIILMMFVPPTA